MSRITDSAKGEDCTVRIPGICNYQPETTVYAHINSVRLGHGVGKKNQDIHGCYACSSCHDVIDGRRKSAFGKEAIKNMQYEAVMETQLKLIEKGLL